MNEIEEKKSHIPILYQDDHIVVVNKPHGMLMHRSPIARDAKVFLLQELRDQLNQHIYLIHRLDRKTGGAVIVALNEEAQKHISKQFQEHTVYKEYHAIVRGFTPAEMTIDYPLINEKGVAQDSVTHFETMEHYEIDLPFGKHQTSRYSLIKVTPTTGRMHQIRKHMAHVRHPIIGDRPHGCNKQNRMWKERFEMTNMMLHAKKIRFVHPVSNRDIEVSGPYWKEFEKVKEISQHQEPSPVP